MTCVYYERLSAAPVAELSALLRERNLFGRRIGAELGFEQRIGLPFAEFERIRSELAPTQFVDAADIFWRLRMVKAPWDLDALRLACRITAGAYEATFRATRSGQQERDVLQRLAIEHMRGGGGTGWGIVTSGPGNYDTVLGSGSDRILEPGDMVWMDGGCCVDGLWSDFGRGGVVRHTVARATRSPAPDPRDHDGGCRTCCGWRPTPRGGCPCQRPCGRNRRAGDVAHLIDRRPRRPRHGVRHHRTPSTCPRRTSRSLNPAW